MPKLTIFVPDQEPLKVAFEDEAEVSIGRAEDNDIAVDHPSISSHHAKLVLGAGGYTLVDLDSTNGTFVDGGLADNTVLGQGAKIVFGQVDALYETEEAAAPASSPAPAAAAATRPAPAAAAPSDEEIVRPMAVRAEISSTSNRPANFKNLSPMPARKKKDAAAQLIAFVGFIGALACIALIGAVLTMKIS